VTIYWSISKEQNETRVASGDILFTLIIEHIFAYLSGVFRKWEVENYGIADVNGVFRGQKESMMSTFEIFCDCIIFGYSLNHLFKLSAEEFNANATMNFWIMIDCILMFCTIGYVYLTQFMMIHTEITKNIYTLYFIQFEIFRK